ncbi:hypothetical protein [Ralstonia sp. 24A2]|uniref:hypothetical protein n=1 Tax=Ralstonia sp. 24A2 TaxID=3447364 RepID=UPI003F6A17AA
MTIAGQQIRLAVEAATTKKTASAKVSIVPKTHSAAMDSTHYVRFVDISEPFRAELPFLNLSQNGPIFPVAPRIQMTSLNCASDRLGFYA